MADEHQDERETTFIFIEAVQNCPTVLDVSSAKITKVRRSKLDPCQVLKVAVSRRLTGEALGRASLSAKLRDGIE